jgi:hypothetical protein
MLRATPLVLMFVAACGCPPKPAMVHVDPGSGSGSAGPIAAPPPTCAGQQPRVAEFYRADAQARDPKHVGELTADNAAMVAAACAKDEARLGPCLAAATTVAAVEACLPPLDDEGSEGTTLPPATATAPPAPVSTP